MEQLESVLQISTVIVSLAVVSAPVLYPKYSLFTRRAESGISQFNEMREEHGKVRLTYVEQGETGFKELIQAAEVAFGYSGKAERICLAIGQPRGLGEFTGFGMGYGIGDNGFCTSKRRGATRSCFGGALESRLDTRTWRVVSRD